MRPGVGAARRESMSVQGHWKGERRARFKQARVHGLRGWLRLRVCP